MKIKQVVESVFSPLDFMQQDEAKERYPFRLRNIKQIISNIDPSLLQQQSMTAILVDAGPAESITFESCSEYSTGLAAYKAASEDIGYITFESPEKWMVLDNHQQHLALRIALKGKLGIPSCIKVPKAITNDLELHPEIADQEQLVVFVSHEDAERENLKSSEVI